MTVDERISHDLKQHLPDVDEAGVWEHIHTASVTARRRRSALLAAASVAAAAALVVGWIGLTNLNGSRLPVTSGPAQEDVPFEQVAAIRQLVDAVNARDAEAFIEPFATEGYFNPHGDFRESSSLFGQTLPAGDVPLVQAWMAMIDAWGLEAELLDCNRPTEIEVAGLRGNWGWPRSGPDASLVLCDVATRWHKLSLELTEGWVYEFRGTQLDNWGFVLLDLNPNERTLPLGYDGLEAWEAWLEANDPLSADRYLNPRGQPSEETNCVDDSCAQWEAALAPNDPELATRLGRLLGGAEKQWSIDGHEFAPGGLIPYDPALADEIDASIHEYLGSQ